MESRARDQNLMNNAKDSDPHPEFLETLKTLDRNQLGKMVIDMKLAGDDADLIRVVVDEIKKRKT